VLDRAGRMVSQAAALREAAGTGTVTGNLAAALTDLFSPGAVAIVPLITFRDELRARLRPTWPTGVPLLTEGVAMIAVYLTAERDLGRIEPGAEVDMLAPMLVGAGHLLFADRNSAPPGAGEVHRMVTTVIAGVVQDPPRPRPQR